MNDQLLLFDIDYSQGPPKRRGHSATPGTGPAGESCRTCRHRYRNVVRSGRAYLKCDLQRARWTGGRATDIRAKDPACRFWEKRDEEASGARV